MTPCIGLPSDSNPTSMMGDAEVDAGADGGDGTSTWEIEVAITLAVAVAVAVDVGAAPMVDGEAVVIEALILDGTLDGGGSATGATSELGETERDREDGVEVESADITARCS